MPVEELREEILRLNRVGLDVNEISDILGISPNLVEKVVKEKHPGRRKIRVEPEIEARIIELRKKGLTLEEIHDKLSQEGIKLSKYKIWDIIRNNREIEKRRVFLEVFRAITNCPSVVSVLLIKRRGIALLMILKLEDCSLLGWSVFNSVTLRDIIDSLDSFVFSRFVPSLVYIPRVPPLVPTRGNDNRLTRYLKRKKVKYAWIPKELRVICEEDIKSLKSKIDQLNSPHNVNEWMEKEGRRVIEIVCKKNIEKIREEALK